MKAPALALLLVATIAIAPIPSTVSASTSAEGVTYLSEYDWLLLDSSTGQSYVEYRLSPIRTEEGSAARYHVEFYLAISEGSVTVSMSGEGWSSEEVVIGADSVSVGGTEYPIFADAGIRVSVEAWEGWAATAEIMYPDGVVAYSIDLGHVPSGVGDLVLRIEADGRAVLREVSSYAIDTSFLTPSNISTFYSPYYRAAIPVPGGYAKLVNDTLLLYLNGSFTCTIDLGRLSGGKVTKSGLVLTETPQVWWVTKKKEVTYWVGIIDPPSCGLRGVASVQRSQLPGSIHYLNYAVELWDGAVFLSLAGSSVIVDTSTGEVLNSSSELDYRASDVNAGIAVLAGHGEVQIIVRDGRDVVLTDMSAKEAAIVDGRVLLLPIQWYSELRIAYLNGTVKDMDLGYSVKIQHITPARDSFAALTYNSTLGVYALVILTPDGDIARVIPLSQSGAYGFGPAEDGTVFASIYGGRLNLSVVDITGIHPLFSYPAPPIPIDYVVPGWGGVILGTGLSSTDTMRIDIYVDGEGMQYLRNVVSRPYMIRPIGDRIYWTFEGGVISFGNDSTRYYPWKGFSRAVWWVGDKAIGARAFYMYDPELHKHLLRVFYDTFTPPANVSGRNVTIDLEGYCSGRPTPEIGPGPSAPTIVIKGFSVTCVGMAGEYLYALNLSQSDYGLVGVWGVGDLTVAMFINFYNSSKHLLVVASPEGVEELNLTEMLVTNLLNYFEMINISKIEIYDVRAALSPDGERVAIELEIGLSSSIGGHASWPVFSLVDTLIIDGDGNYFFASRYLGLDRLLSRYPLGWVSPTKLVVGNPPAIIDFGGEEPEVVASVPGPNLRPESAIIPYLGGFLAATSHTKDSGATYSVPVLITATGADYLLPELFWEERSEFAELLPLGDSYALIKLSNSTYTYYIARVYEPVTNLSAVSPSRLIIGPDGSLTLDCYGDCEAVITSPDGDERILHKGEKAALLPDVEYSVRIGDEEYEVKIPALVTGQVPPPSEGGAVGEHTIIEGAPFCPSTIWIELGRRVEVYDSGKLVLTIPYPDAWPLKDLVGERCLQLRPGTHYILIAYRDTSGKIVRTEALNLTVAPATGTLSPIQLSTETTTTTTPTTTTATTTTTTQPPPQHLYPQLWLLLILLIIAALIAFLLWRRRRKGPEEERINQDLR